MWESHASLLGAKVNHTQAPAVRYSLVEQAAWRRSRWGCQSAVTGRRMTNYLSSSIRAATVLSTAPPDGPNYT